MSNLRPPVRTALQNLIENYQDEHTAIDLLRVIQDEANLMKETEEVRDAISMDPFENLRGISSKALERFQKMLRVTVCDRQRCGADFARTHAVVAMMPQNSTSQVELVFTYERNPRRGAPPNEKGHYPCQVSYSIELGDGHGERQRLMEVTVWAASNVPSAEPAVCIQDDSEGGWEDIDGEQHVDTVVHTVESTDGGQLKKKQKTRSSSADDATSDETDPVETNTDMDRAHDEYAAFLDPDVMQSFLKLAGLPPMDDGTAFFLLMTFPFYEHEWDIVGLVLDQIFGGDTDDEEEAP